MTQVVAQVGQLLAPQGWQHDGADALIARCNAATVEEASARITALSPEERDMLLREYRRRPDGRFGDNLLLACSVLSQS